MFDGDRDPVIEETPPVLDLVVPVRPSEPELDAFVRRWHRRLRGDLPGAFRITLVCRGESDATARAVRRLPADLEGVRTVRPERGGHGRAVRTAWSRSTALVLAHADVDSPGDRTALPTLVGPLLAGEADLALEVKPGSTPRVLGSIERQVVSRCYSLILRGTARTRVADARFDVRAVRGDVARRLLPLTDESGRFFDTELLVLAERAGLRPGWVPTAAPVGSFPAAPPARAQVAAALNAYVEAAAPGGVVTS